jgi:hypothetical protein
MNSEQGLSHAKFWNKIIRGAVLDLVRFFFITIYAVLCIMLEYFIGTVDT